MGATRGGLQQNVVDQIQLLKASAIEWRRKAVYIQLATNICVVWAKCNLR